MRDNRRKASVTEAFVLLVIKTIFMKGNSVIFEIEAEHGTT